MRIHTGPLEKCKSCNKHRCLFCASGYTLSTADNEHNYCSRRCENKDARAPEGILGMKKGDHVKLSDKHPLVQRKSVKEDWVWEILDITPEFDTLYIRTRQGIKEHKCYVSREYVRLHLSEEELLARAVEPVPASGG
jgi:hypothetical protein